MKHCASIHSCIKNQSLGFINYSIGFQIMVEISTCVWNAVFFNDIEKHMNCQRADRVKDVAVFSAQRVYAVCVDIGTCLCSFGHWE